MFSSVWCEQVMTDPTKSQPNGHRNYSSEGNKMTNDVQRDQSAASPLQEQTEGVFPEGPTNPPFVSFLVTKSPGTSVSNIFHIAPDYAPICE